MKAKILLSTMLTIVLFFACQTGGDEVYLEENSYAEIEANKHIYKNIPIEERSFPIAMTGDNQMKSSGELWAVLGKAEYYTTANSGQMGNTIIFGEEDRGNKQGYRDPYLGGPFDQNFHWTPVIADEVAPFVPDWFISADEVITYYVDANRPAPGLSVAETNQAIHNAMNTWNDVTCSDFEMTEIPYDGRPAGDAVGLFGYEPGYGHIGTVDILFGGWMPGDMFDQLAPGGSEFIAAVTFTNFFTVFIDGEFRPVDGNHDGMFDAIYREVYFNANLDWSTDGSANTDLYDVETVALHEAGHGLSQAHFGKGFVNKGGMHFAPRAVMNAAYSGIQREIGKTDNGGHCSLWASWPNYSQRP